MSDSLNISYTYHPGAVIGSVFPTFGPPSGFTNVSIFGVYLSPRTACKFGARDAVRSVWLNAAEVVCVSPPDIPYGVLLLQLTAPDRKDVGASFTIVPEPDVDGIHPSTGPAAGGTLVSVFGSNLQVNSSCAFGTSSPVPARWLGPDELECRTTPHVAGHVSFAIVSGAHTYMSAQVVFSFDAPCDILSITPARGPGGGGIRAVIGGSGFSPHGLVVRFGKTIVQGIYINSTTIECITPQHFAGVSSVSTSPNGQNFCGGSAPFLFESMTVQAVHPLVGPQGGGTLVRIDGNQFPASSTLQCGFGPNGYSVAQRLSPTRIECIAPVGVIGRVLLTLFDAGAVQASSTAEFEYQAMPTISSVSPSIGVTRGGTSVVVRGNHFSSRSTALLYLRCRFNLTAVPGEYLNSTAVVCVSPPHEVSRAHIQPPGVFVAGRVPLELSSNILDFTSSELQFDYSDAVFVSSLTPSLGPSNGNTIIQIGGFNFVASEGLACLFGQEYAVATFHSTQRISCSAPRHASGVVPVRVIVSGNVTSETHAIYQYKPQSRVSYISPANGPAAGGTVLVVAGSSFAATRQLRCRFGEVIVPAVRASSEFINCTTPQHMAGVVGIEVSDNGVDFSSDSSFFLFQNTVSVQSIAPGLIPINSTVAFRVLGANFLPASTCQINDGVAALYSTYLSSNELICVFDASLEIGEANVRVSNNLQDFTASSSIVRLTAAWSVTTVAPVMGPALGGTAVQVAGTNFQAENAMACRFGAGNTPVSARFISSTQLECTSLPHSPVNVTLEVSVNNQDYSTSGVIFEYMPAAAVRLLRPHQGPVGGGTLVVVQGQLFSERAASLGYIYCRFGNELSPGRYVASDTLQCVSPPHLAGNVTMEISMNSQDFTAGGAVFSYVGPTIQSIHPTIGPEHGGTLITVDGVHMPRGAPTQCRFGASGSAPAVWVSATRMQCTAPPLVPSTVVLGLLTTGGGAVALSQQTFESQTAAAVYSVLPDAGPVLGGTKVVLVGAHFSFRSAALSHLQCRFNLTVSSAHWLNSSTLECVAPPFEGEHAGAVALRMSNNRLDFTDGMVAFTYLPDVLLESMMPANGPVLGGSLVTVLGENFLSRPSKCRFGSSEVSATYVSSNVLHCMSPPRVSITEAVVHVSVSTNDGADFAVPRLRFTYQSDITIQALVPAAGPQQGRTLISVLGDGFTDSVALRCKFGELVVDATFVSTSIVNCTSPAQTGGAVALEVSTNAIQFSSSNVTYVFLQRASVLFVSPSAGPVRGSTNVTIIGVGLVSGSTCRFGQQAALATVWVSLTEVVCVSPPLATGIYSLEVTSNLQDYTTDRMAFEYVLASSILVLEPITGPALGGTAVQVAGTNFMSGPGLMCRFGAGNTPVSARFISSTQLECTSLPHSPVNVTLEVSVNNQDYSTSGVIFEYMPAAAVRLLRPHQGPVGGGTLVVVQGQLFSERAASLGYIYCRFGNELSPGRYVASDTLQCVSPPHLAGNVTMEISMNSQDFTAGGAVFSYVGPTIQSIHPTIGPEHGGTLITVDGVHMPRGAPTQCRFGASGPAPAVWVSATRMQCTAPPLVPSTVVLGLLTTGGGAVALSQQTFESQTAAAVYSVLPDAGPVLGGTKVVLVGAHFSFRSAALSHLQCRFNLTVSSAHWLNSSTLECVAPPFEGEHAGAVALRMSNNRLDFTDGMVAFTYLPDVLLESMMPANGPVLGGSLVTVLGENFLSRPSKCRFGSSEVSATYVSSNVLHCMSPPRVSITEAVVHVSVSTNDGADFAVPRLRFTYQSDITIQALVPAAGPQQGRTLISVLGDGFTDSVALRCKFGELVVDATFVSTSIVNCTSPAQTGGAVALEVSTNAIQFSSSNVTYVFLQRASVLFVSPSAGPVRGSTNVTIIGVGLVSGSTCRFGQQAALATVWVSLTEVVCVSPPLATGIYSLEVTSNLQDYTTDRMAFEYVLASSILVLEPITGPALGGTAVQVAGTNFMSGPGLMCRFGAGNTPVSARFISSTQLECTSLPHSPVNVTLEVSVNNQDYSTSGVIFEYMPAAAVRLLRPHQGPVGGGTLVVVQGQLFSERAASLGYIYCRFGNELSPGRYVASDTLQCVSPPHLAGNVTMEISMNSQDFTAGGAVFSYVGPTIQSIHPTIGPEHGGTSVSVSVDRLPFSLHTYCVFGALSVSAVRMNDSVVVCTSPQSVPVEVGFQLVINHEVACRL